MNRIALRLVFCTTVVLGAVSCSVAVDGTAVSIAYRFSDKCKYCPANDRDVPERSVYDNTFWGRLVRYTIADNATVRTDSLLDYLAYYPAIRVDGKKIAFFLQGGLIDNNNDLAENVIAPGIYLSSIDGTGLTKIIDYSAFGANNSVFLDWPKGDWIYFHNIAKSEGEIWRVNAATSASEKVIDYVPSDVETARSDLRRWSCNAAGDYDVTHISGSGDYDSKNAHCFPNASFLTCQSGTIKDCNQSMGASGRFCASYYGIGHDFIDIYAWNFAPGHSEFIQRITAAQAAAWDSIPSVGKGGEWIHWACNSDQWVLQQLGWAGHADNLDKAGSNAVYINWVRKQTIRVTANPENPDMGVNSISYCNTAGDFWVAGGSDDAYQDTSGAWVEIGSSAAIKPHQGQVLAHGVASGTIALSRSGIVVFADRNGLQEAFSLRGSRVGPTSIEGFDRGWRTRVVRERLAGLK